MAPRATSTARWPSAIILLHWVMALALGVMLWAGFAMTSAAHVAETTGDFSITVLGLRLFDAYQLHKSVGVVLFALVLTRTVVRFRLKGPDLPSDLTRLEQIAATTVQLALYALMLGMPITGWLLAASSTLSIPTMVFGLFELPHPIGPDAEREAALAFVHWAGAWAMIILAALHTAAALKHHFFDRNDILQAMLPERSTTHRRRSHHAD
ncbi:cytochrome b [Ruegeria arenilitoris]|uniref:cytochrome b n=1 Tax=Ruegeria arenilitoris TaxID=1173585 RepID=UPI00147E4BCB|nr:cytochrome b [Ruegeria arenilitoris]